MILGGSVAPLLAHIASVFATASAVRTTAPLIV
jgi:hypothetical protein